MNPTLYEPMLAKTAPAPFDSKDWIFEIKWDGIRAISYINDDLSIRSRNGKELVDDFPELEELKTSGRHVVLDGEIVVIRNGKADFQAVLERSRASSPRESLHMTRELPATYVLFDILEKDGKPLVGLPLHERKRVLKESVKEGTHVILSVPVEEEGKAYYQAALAKGIEGIVAKKKDSPYEPGTRSGNWLKVKKILSCDSVVFGYTEGEGSRRNTFGALILGMYHEGKPVYVGKVGTGFSDATITLLMKTFEDLKTEEKTLDGADVPQKITWLKPKLVCEVSYQTMTKDGKLRASKFNQLRPDKNAPDCTLDQIVDENLREYVSKRDFSVSPEPAGTIREGEGSSFVVQEHHARRLHYDFRLERQGVMKSWAVPKGLPLNPGEKRLAIEVEDHPLEYGKFEGTIPKGEYGAGTVTIWDKGSYQLKVWDEKMIEITLKGERLRGRYVLAKFKKAGEKGWILLKARD